MRVKVVERPRRDTSKQETLDRWEITLRVVFKLKFKKEGMLFDQVIKVKRVLPKISLDNKYQISNSSQTVNVNSTTTRMVIPLIR